MRFSHLAALWCALGSVNLAGCSSELPEYARESKLPASVKSAAIPLERALSEKMLEAKPLASHSTRTEMAITLKPLVTSQPWIRIDPGWIARNAKFSEVSFVTTQTIYVRLPKRDNFKVRARHVRLHWTRSTGLPADASLERSTDDRLVDFLRKTGDGEKDPDWKVLQVAVWALSDDIPYDTVKPPVEGGSHALLGDHEYATAGQIQRVTALLATAGHDKEDFKIWQTIVEELYREVAAYEKHYDDEADRAKAFVPFRKVGNLYPLDLAAEVMFSAFDRHDGPAGRDFRRHAVEVLGEYALGHLGGTREVNVLKQRARFEADREILRSMREIIALHEKRGGGAPVGSSPAK